MAIADWNTIRSNIFAGESGGDYDALYGYSNRPGRQFENTRLTDMTVDQALSFSNTSGPYAQWVKGQVGRVATPMGAYQVVGTTLRDAKRGLGLRGDEKMTPDMQDKIGQWIYQTQGTGAWEGYRPDAGARSVAADAMAALGKGKTMNGMGPTTPQPQERKGFLGGLLSDPDLLDRLAIGFAGMTLNPNVGLQQMAAQRIAGRAEERKAQTDTNKTVQMLQNMGADPKLIELAQAGYAKEAISMAYAQPKEKYATMTGEQLNAQYGTKLDPEKLYNISPTGQVTQVGGGGVTISNQQETEFQKAVGKGIGEQALDLQAAGSIAQRNKGSYAVLADLLQNAPQGGQGAFVAAASNLGLKLEKASDVEAAQAIISQLVPQQRQPGSGPMSDADLELFKRSLPRIINSPSGNRLILQTLNAISDYDIQRALIAQDLMTGAIDQKEYYSMLNSLENPLALFKQQSSGAPPGMSREEATKLLMGQ